MAAKMTQNPALSSPVIRDWRTIWTASLLWDMPEPEKMGSFCPRIRVVMQSMVDIPVLM